MNTHPVLLKLARQGDPRAIAALMNDALREQDVWVKATRDDRSLQVMLKAPRALDQLTCVAFIRWGMARLQTPAIDHIHLYAWQTYGDFPDWATHFSLEPSPQASLGQPPAQAKPASAMPDAIEGGGESAAPAPKVAVPELTVLRPAQPAKAVKFGVVVVVALMLYFVVASV